MHGSVGWQFRQNIFNKLQEAINLSILVITCTDNLPAFCHNAQINHKSHRYKHAAVISAYNAILQTRSDVLTREGGNRRVHGGKWLLHELLAAHCRGVRRHDCFAEAVRGPL